jgi:hypothetical protein
VCENLLERPWERQLVVVCGDCDVVLFEVSRGEKNGSFDLPSEKAAARCLANHGVSIG